MGEPALRPLCVAREALSPAVRASAASRIEFLSVVRFLLGSRGALLDRAAEIVDRKRVVRLRARGSGRAVFLVGSSSHRQSSYVCSVTAVPTCTCHDFVHTVAKGAPDVIYVRPPCVCVCGRERECLSA